MTRARPQRSVIRLGWISIRPPQTSTRRITIFIWAFALAAIYKATKSVIACAVYHSFIDAIGAVYDWNLLFDSFPGNTPANVYRLVWLLSAVVLWFIADQKD